MGDGTYYHSGLLAIRAAVAAGVNITYKILFNDAVAMTGGQPVDGPLTVARVTQQVYSEGVQRITVVSDAPDKYGKADDFAPGVTIHHRREMSRLQRMLRETPGVSVLVYDQAQVPDKTRIRAQNKAARIFEQAGIEGICVPAQASTQAAGHRAVKRRSPSARERLRDIWP